MKTSKIKVRFLSTAKYLIGIDEKILEFKEPPTFRELLEKLYEGLPKLKEVEEKLKERNSKLVIVVNGKTPRDEEVLSDGSEVYVLPPASGG